MKQLPLSVIFAVLSLAVVGCGNSTDKASRLAGSEWGFRGQDLPFVKFGSENRLSGNAGCNHFTGSFQIESGEKIMIGPLAATRKMCAQEVMEEEKAFLTGLQKVNGFKREKGRLELYQDGTLWKVLVWRDFD